MSIMPSAPMTAEDRARLRNSGQWLLNRIQKRMDLIEEAHRDHEEGVEHTHPNPLLLWMDLGRLLAVGAVLGPAGALFSARGTHITALDFMGTGREMVADVATKLVEKFHERHEMEGERYEEKSGVEHLLSPEEADPFMRRDSITWDHEQLCGVPFSMDGVGPKQNCNFCGARSYPDRVLLACGGCKAAIYCDKRCQTMDRKKHKADCKAKAAQNKAEENKAEETKAEETKGVKGEAA